MSIVFFILFFDISNYFNKINGVLNSINHTGLYLTSQDKEAKILIKSVPVAQLDRATDF